ncbi:MAG TPA: HD domain-containing protein [Candidatus Acidoferrales bacterium]|nr:HD domain-containing protein [Candidatus Acidoferrales bacterium]
MLRRKEHKIDNPILLQIGKLADSIGMQSYVVGGYVRDLILSRKDTSGRTESKDIDVMVIGDPISFAREVQRELNATALVVFEKFRTVQMIVGDVKVEIVGARKESYDADSRKPHVKEATLEEDLSRRDFTINAMAIMLNPKFEARHPKLDVIDPFDGKGALAKKMIDTPLDPEETFSEDPLRILRAIRFACRFDFALSPRVKEAIVKMKDRLGIVSQERITEEFLKIISASRPSLGLKLMQDTGVMTIVFKEISDMPGVEQRQDHHHKDVFLHTICVVDNLAQNSNNIWLRFAGLVHDIAKPETKKFVEGVGWTFHGHDEIGARKIKKIFQRMKFPMDSLPYVEKLVRLHLRPMALAVEGVTDSAVRRLLFDAGDDFEDLMKLCRADITSKNRALIKEYSRNYDSVEQRAKTVEEKDKIRNWKPPVNGDEIMEIFRLKPGKEVGMLKKAVETAVLDGIIPNDHDAALEFLKSKYERILAEG